MYIFRKSTIFIYMKKDRIHTQGVIVDDGKSTPAVIRRAGPSKNPLNVGGPRRKFPKVVPPMYIQAGFDKHGWKKVKVDYGLNTKGRGGHFFVDEDYVPHANFNVKTYNYKKK